MNKQYQDELNERKADDKLMVVCSFVLIPVLLTVAFVLCGVL